MIATARLAELLASLSIATDAAAGLPRETALRTSLIAVRLARAADVQGFELADVYYAGLLRFLGCSAYSYEAAQLAAGDDLGWMTALTPVDPDKPARVLTAALRALPQKASLRARARALGKLMVSPETPRELATSHCELALVLARQLGMSEGVLRTLREMYERWDAKGFPAGTSGVHIARPARVLHVAYRLASHYSLLGPEASLAVLAERSGRELDPELADSARGLGAELFIGLSSASVWTLLLNEEPRPFLYVEAARIPAVARVFGHFSDVKSPWTAGHSAAVAELCVRAAEALSLAPALRDELRIAALLHDIGRVSVPNGVWDKPGPLDVMERELAEGHARETQRILARTPLLERYAQIASAAHERSDGSGYPRSLGEGLSLSARILAAADVWQALRERRPHRLARGRDEAVRIMRAEVASGRLAEQVVSALLDDKPAERVRPSPALSEREAEVLRLVARGLANKEIAAKLFISPATVKRHLENLFERTGVRTRAAVTVWALEHGYL
jgi:HD-GYP domain-containing protein (c-di-GMP phosphodiesterase class II)